MKVRSSASGCPQCVGVVPSPTNNLATRFPEVAAQLMAERSGVRPEELLAGSSRKVWWQCDQGHEWRTSPGHRTSSGTQCPHCRMWGHSRTEVHLAFELAAALGSDPLDHKVEGASRRWDVDFVLRDERLLVEYDGVRFHADKSEKDLRKTADLVVTGWRVVRVREPGLPLLDEEMDLSLCRPRCTRPGVLRHSLPVAAHLALLVGGGAREALERYTQRSVPLAFDEAAVHIRACLDQRSTP